MDKDKLAINTDDDTFYKSVMLFNAALKRIEQTSGKDTRIIKWAVEPNNRRVWLNYICRLVENGARASNENDVLRLGIKISAEYIGL